MKRILAGMTLVLALACGGVGVEDDEGTPPAAPGSSPGAAADAVAPASALQGGGFAATADGVCRLQESCACAESESYQACVAAMSDMPAEVLSCIVANDCPSFCGGAGVRCVESWYATQSEISRQGHETRMEIMENWPTGACSPGQTEVRDQYGSLVRCQ